MGHTTLYHILGRGLSAHDIEDAVNRDIAIEATTGDDEMARTRAESNMARAIKALTAPALALTGHRLSGECDTVSETAVISL